MKKLLFLILVLFTANVVFSQITTNVSLKCQVYASSGTAPTFNIQSLVSDELSKYDGSNVAAGDKLYVIEGSECYELHISSVSSGIGSTLNIVVYDSTGTLATVPNGQAAVIRKYSTQQVPFIPSGLRNDLASCILQKLASVIDNIGSDGNGIYSGSDTLSVGDTTVVTTLAGSALQVGNTIQSPSSITTINDINHWGTYDGWDRATYSYGGHSGYYFIRGNGTAASKTALSVNDVMHEWSFIGQKSPTEDNYALIMKPTVDEITGGNNWGRLDLQGADFGTWLSLRRTGIRAGTASNYTTFPALRPVTNNQFWQYNTDGTGEYKTPGNMTVTNPLGGTQTLQASLDSLYQAANQIVIATDSFYINDQEQPVYVVGVGDTITFPSAAEYTAGSGIDISIGGVISADDDSPTNEIQTLSILGSNITLSNGGGTIAAPNGIYGGSGVVPLGTVASGNFYNDPFEEQPPSFPVWFVWPSDTPSISPINNYPFFGIKGGDWSGGSPVTAIGIENEGGIPLASMSYQRDTVFSSIGVFEGGVGATIKSALGIFQGFTMSDTTLLFTANNIQVYGGENNFTNLPTRKPVSAPSFWQHNTNGTAEYVTPGQMFITNPYGGTNTLQATLDSINVAGGDGSITNEGFLGVTAGSGTSSVLQGYNSEGTTTGAGTTINVSGGGLSIAETTSTNGGSITISSTALTAEVDGSITNELQTIANTSNATTHTATLSNSGGSLQLVEGANTTLTTTGTGLDGIVTVAVPVTNPLGGSNTLQASLDSLNANGADGNGIYSGSGNVPNGTTAATLGTFTLGNSLGNHLYIENGNETALYSDLSRVSVKDSVTISSAGSDGAAGQVLVGTAGDGSYWGNAGSLPVVNPLGGANTIQASLDSIRSASRNGIFTALNNNDTVRVTTTNLKSVWNINNNTSGYIRIQRPSAAFVQGLNITSPGGITGSQVHSAFTSDRVSIQDRLDNVYITSSYDMILGGRIASGDFAQMSLKTGVAEFTSSNGGRLKLLDAGLTTSITIQPPVVPIAYTLTLPTTDGNSGEFLQTNGSGVTTWAAPAAPTNVGGISAMHTGASYSYTASTLGSAVNALILSGTVAFKSGMAKISSDSGHGIQVSFGGPATCQITGFVTLTGDDIGDGPYYLQIYVNGSPLYSSVYASTLPAPLHTNAATATISHLAELNNNDIVTIRVHSAAGSTAHVLSAGLTVVKTQ